MATPFPTDQMHIAMADRCGGQANFHFAWLGRLNIDLFNDQWLTKLVANSGLHGKLLSEQSPVKPQARCLVQFNSDSCQKSNSYGIAIPEPIKLQVEALWVHE